MREQEIGLRTRHHQSNDGPEAGRGMSEVRNQLPRATGEKGALEP